MKHHQENSSGERVPAVSAGALARVTDAAQRAAERLAQRPENTARAYASDFRGWCAWCAEWGGSPINPEPGALATYVQHLADTGKAPSTIERALTGVRAGLLESGMAATEARDRLAVARDLARLLRNDAIEAGHRERQAKAATVDHLRAMVGALDLTGPSGLRDRAVLLLGFSAALRRSEAAALDWADVTEVDEGLEVRVHRTKTHTTSTVAVPFGSRSETCPVRSVLSWRIAAVDAGADTDGPVFLRIDRHGNLGRAPSGKGSSDGRMTPQAIGKVVKRAAELAGLDPEDFAGHSLRRGFVTEARRAGADELRIARTGGWADGSRQVHRYTEDVDRWTDHPLRGVGL
jgi:site-specific recombinase XerD